MKKIFIILLLVTSFSNVASAEITRQYNHGEQTFKVSSFTQTNYDSDMKLSAMFTKEYNLKYQDGHVSYSLLIMFDPIDREKPMKSYEFFKDEFFYRLEGDVKLRRGAFFNIYDPGIGESNKNIDVTVRELLPGNYSVTTSGHLYQHGGHFYTAYTPEMVYYRKYKMKQLELSFYDDIILAVKENKEVVIQIPYAANLSDIKKIEYIAFKIDKDTLSEWNNVVRFDLVTELKQLTVK